MFLNAVMTGWVPGQGGAEARELFTLMSWTGRGNAVKLAKRIVNKKDGYI